MKTKTEALEALLNRALGLLDTAKEGFKFLKENSQFTESDAAVVYKREIAKFDAKYLALWDSCEAVGRGEFDKVAAP